MKINDKRGVATQKFKDLVIGDVFDYNGSIYIKIVDRITLYDSDHDTYCNVFNLTTNCLDFLRVDDVEKVECTLNISNCITFDYFTEEEE